MSTHLRLAAAELRAASRRLRRDGIISGWRSRILAVSLLTVAITALLARTIPLSFSSSSTRLLSTVATAKSSADGIPFPLSQHRCSFLFLHSSNSSAEAFVTRNSPVIDNCDASERKINHLSPDFLHSSPPENISMAIKPSGSDLKSSASVETQASSIDVQSSANGSRVLVSTVFGIHSEEFRSDNQVRELNASSMSEIYSKEMKPSDGEKKIPASTSYKIPTRSLPPNEALIYAMKEIEGSHFVADDPNLYAPLFFNVSVFKRSYELMERILKVYIYRDGQRPIFHMPELKGIYASEGWFMKLIEENKHFVVKDPGQAHLFYLPYSTRRMELALYVPGSHDMKPMSRFLRDYVNQISLKYPFWNRTRGSDHFLVACHDWGPYTTNMHAELRKNTIKALCNADASEGYFIRGKDVSLPETTIRTPRRPLRQVGGKPVSQRPILAFFAGNMHGRVRPVLLAHWGNNKDEDMKIYGLLPNRISKKMSYIEHMKSSKFCVCPMGFEVNSPRIVEAFYYECVPVIIADNFVLPFEEVLDWSAFSIVIAEKDIPKLKDILLGIPLGQYMKMQESVRRLQRHFLWHARPEKYDLFHMILHSIWSSRLNHIRPLEE